MLVWVPFSLFFYSSLNDLYLLSLYSLIIFLILSVYVKSFYSSSFIVGFLKFSTLIVDFLLEFDLLYIIVDVFLFGSLI